MAVVVRGGAAILSPQSSVSARLQTRPVASEAQCTTGSTAPGTTGHCVLLLQRGGQSTAGYHTQYAVMLLINIVSTKVSFVHIAKCCCLVAVVVAVVSQSM